MREKVKSRIIDTGVVAIARGIPFDKLEPLVEALIKGGIGIMEFAINHLEENFLEENARRIRFVKERFDGRIFVGAGSVLDLQEAEAMVEAGAVHLVSPSTSPDVIKYCNSAGVVSIPGALTPTECVLAYNSGADFVKLFPAGLFGVEYIKALMAPLCHIPFMVVGNVDTKNLPEFIAAGAKAVGVGSALIDNKALNSDNYRLIEEEAGKYINITRRK